ncbi:MAG TPA: hypothetical protein VHY56_14340 [Candidatus Binataceae bacterium]|nr:hypothetical protein [Candidatus Binataceae bacterium]
MTWKLPTVAGIQRVTALVASLIAVTLALALSSRAALAVLLGATIMIVNLYLLAILGHFILGLAQHGASAALGAVLAPFKMMLIIAAVYVIISSGRVNLPGFGIGLLTQLAAVFIETWRVSLQP